MPWETQVPSGAGLVVESPPQQCRLGRGKCVWMIATFAGRCCCMGCNPHIRGRLGRACRPVAPGWQRPLLPHTESGKGRRSAVLTGCSDQIGLPQPEWHWRSNRLRYTSFISLVHDSICELVHCQYASPGTTLAICGGRLSCAL